MRRTVLLATRDGRTLDAINDLIALLEDVLFLVSDDTRKLSPLVPPHVPAPPAVAPKPIAKSASKPIPTLKLPPLKRGKR